MHQMDGRQPPKQADIILGAVEGLHGSQNTPMLWRFIIAGTNECFEGHAHPQPPQKLHPLAWGCVWGARGPFPLAAAMVVAVVTPVVFCIKATEIFNKNTKTSCL